ncbi:MAG: DUF2183 domain-containing protein [Prolixibacteraceae bacterium]|nr:DUF2183 domain-containing protein [Prolixibacteraceae bacterium]
MTKNTQTIDYFERKSRGIFRKLKIRLKYRLGWLGVPQIVPFRGFGSTLSGEAYIEGSLTEDKGLEKPEENNSLKENILAMLKRYSGDQIPGAKIAVRIGSNSKELVTRETGIFNAKLSLPEQNRKEPTKWMMYEAVLLDNFNAEAQNYASQGEILIPGTDADFGIISDIDDTMMVSHSTQTLRKIRLMLTRNSKTRKPFPGVEAFYNALHVGATLKSANPFFYISSSEWNLYDLIDDFCSYNNFPKGVFLLREITPGILNLWKQGGGNHLHKYEKMLKVLEMYPNLNFVLVGDNGQHDPEIYAKVARLYPERIKVIYIRTVKKRKTRWMKTLIAEMETIGVQMVFTPDTINAAQHAQSIKLIAKSAVEGIVADSFVD